MKISFYFSSPLPLLLCSGSLLQHPAPVSDIQMHFTELPDSLLYCILSFLVPPFCWWSLHTNPASTYLQATIKQIKKDFLLSRQSKNPFPCQLSDLRLEASAEELQHLNPTKLIILFPVSQIIWETLSNLTNLQHVQIASPRNIDFSHFQHIISLYIDFRHELKYNAHLTPIQWPPHLKYLVLKNVPFNQGELEIPCGVETLSLQSAQSGHLLRLNSDLKQLDLYQTTLPILSHIPSLESIHLRNCIYAGANISLTVNLTHIHITDTGFSNQYYIQDICNIMKFLPKVTYLELNVWTHLIDFSFLQDLSHLQVLCLPDKYINVEWIKTKIQARPIQVQLSDFKAPWKPFCLPYH